MSSAQQPRVASDYPIGQHRYGAAPPSQAALGDGVGQERAQSCSPSCGGSDFSALLLRPPPALLPRAVLFKNGSPGARTCLFTDRYYLFVRAARSREGSRDL